MGTKERGGIGYQPGCPRIGGATPPRIMLHPDVLIHQPPWCFLLSSLQVSLVDVVDERELGG